MKKLLVLCMALLLLAGCSGPSLFSDVLGQHAASADAASASTAAVKPPAASSADDSVDTSGGPTTLLLERDDKSYTVQLTLPANIYYKGTNLYQAQEGAYPPDILVPDDKSDPMYSLKVGAISLSAADELRQVDDDLIEVPYYFGDSIILNHTDDPTLPYDSYYIYQNNIIAYTLDANTPRSLKATYYAIPADGVSLVVLFFHDPDSPTAKPYFETIIDTVSITPQ